jgi:hypothetical protein
MIDSEDSGGGSAPAVTPAGETPVPTVDRTPPGKSHKSKKKPKRNGN